MRLSPYFFHALVTIQKNRKEDIDLSEAIYAPRDNFMSKIPFNKPFFSGKELTYIQKALEQLHISGDGPFTKQSQSFLEKTLGTQKVLLTTSCTDALEMCAHLLDFGPGDEFIVPSFTFVSTANAFALLGAKPVFCDIRKDTLNLDERKLEKLITPKTKAIVVVHYAGVACEMDKIMEIANRHQIPVVEDNAHGLFGKYKGKFLGTFGALATQSFHETKNISCGEGGALLINDKKYIERAEILRDKGTNRSKFMKGMVDKYTWVDVGSSYLVSDILAAVLWAQLETYEWIQTQRKNLWENYFKSLSSWANVNGVELPYVPKNCDQAYHMFYIKLPSLETRDSLIESLRAQNIFPVFHYIPLHSSPMGRKLGGEKTVCPVTDETSDTLLRLPFFNTMTAQDVERVVKAVTAFEMPTQMAA